MERGIVRVACPGLWEEYVEGSDDGVEGGEELIGVLARMSDGSWRCALKRIPQGLICQEAKFHGTKDVVLLLNSAEKKPDILVAVSITEFSLDESSLCDLSGIEAFCTKKSHEALRIERFAELSEGKKEKLRCGCRGYICLVGDERRLEVYEITGE